MRIFAVDCSAKSASAAISEDGKLLCEAYTNVGLTHSQTLMPMVSNILACAEIALSSVDIFAITAGPGSFTGVRIGAAAVKGLAMAENKPCLSISALEAIAYNLKGQYCIACAVMDARCEQVYTALFRCSGENVQRLTDDSAMLISELSDLLKQYEGEPVVFAGDGALLCLDALQEKVRDCTVAPEHIRYQRASGVAACALDKLNSGGETVRADALRPLYLRAPQAERNLMKRKTV